MAGQQGFRCSDEFRCWFFSLFRSGHIPFKEAVSKLDADDFRRIDQFPDGKIPGQIPLFIQGFIDPLSNGRLGKQFVVHGILL